MKLHAISLGVLVIFATLGLVAAQDRPAQKSAAAPAERDPDVRAIKDLLASFVKAYDANSGGGKGPEFKKDVRRGEGQGEWYEPVTSRSTVEIHRQGPT